MKEIFYEESAKVQNEKSAKTKYYIFKTISIISYVMTVLLGIIFLLTTPLKPLNIVISIVPVILFLFSGILLGKFKNRFYVDYDYTFVTGSIRVAKVIKNVKRKLVLKFDVSNIEKLGKYGSETYISYEKMPGVKRKILTLNNTPADEKDFYYLVVNVDETKYLLVFECTEMFMATILKFGNKLILEKDYK